MQSEPNDPPSTHDAPGDINARSVSGQVQRFLSFIVNEPSEELSEITGANKRKICGEILVDVLENIDQPEPVLAVRRRLTNYATLTAYDLVLTRTPRQSEFRGITGEMRHRLPELAKVNTLLRDFFGREHRPPGTAEEMADLLRARAIVFNLWCRAYNVARI